MSQISADCPRIGLLNLMPAPALPKTEHQWRDGFMGLADVVPGDEVVVEVEGVGRLVNRIVSETEFFSARKEA